MGAVGGSDVETGARASSFTRADTFAALALAGVAAGLFVFVRSTGFDHVSDDDFARVTIAQAFAKSPRLDPSGTSWLPFPFWLLGGLLVPARSLAVARFWSVVTAAASVAVPFLALRRTGVARRVAVLASMVALLTPWMLWLGATTVPEVMTANLAAGAAIVLGDRQHAGRWWWGLPLVAACLSRYEVWPLALVVGAALAVRRPRRATWVAASLALAGPLAWMLWNQHAHGSALHFVDRVARYRRALGEGATSPVSEILTVLRLAVVTRPEVTVLLALALPALRSREVRERRLVPLLAALAVVAFLAYGAARDGAPTHHPERALVGAQILIALVATSLLAARAQAERGRIAKATMALVAALLAVGMRPLWTAPPASSPSEDRSAQIARGERLRGSGPIEITPCAFEHFALLAAFAAPERAVLRPARPRADAEACPAVTTSGEGR